MLDALGDKLNHAIRHLSGQGRISESNVREAMADVRAALLDADVHLEVVDRFCADVQQQALGESVLQSLKPGQQMIKIVYDELVRVMAYTPDEEPEPSDDDDDGLPPPSSAGLLYVSPGPTIVMMCGLQGSGKTTTCGKLAAYLKKRGKRVMLAAADLQRPAAVTQLQVLSEQVQSQIDGTGSVHFYAEPQRVAEYGKAVGAAVTVCRNALIKARQTGIDVLILDTAGRLHINDALMDELRQVNGAVQPHQVLLVVDAMTGQDAVTSAKAFHSQLELDGVILTKFDSDTRGGAALSVKHVTGAPIKFIGTGEKLDALEEFHPDRIASRILGMGDVLSLVEKAQQEVSQEEAEALQEKIAKGKMTLDDFLGQLKTLRRMGSMKSLLGLIPGVGKQLKDLPIDDKQIDQTEAIIHSMTRAERRDVELLNSSRRRRIATGSGTDTKDVSQLVKGFEMMSQMGKQMAGMGLGQRLGAMRNMNANDLAAMSGGRNPFGSAKGPTKVKSKFKPRKKKSR